MNLERMDSCAGLIISPKELVKLAGQISGNINQRGSICGAESILVKYGDFCMAAFCNRRKAYMTKLPLYELFGML
jgi:hypothetical protein